MATVSNVPTVTRIPDLCTTRTKTKKQNSTPKYTELQLKAALKAIQDGSPVATVAKNFNIPRTTLRYKKNGILKPVIQRRGTPCILGEDIEARLVEWIIVMSARGFPVGKYQLLNSIKSLLREMKRREEVFTKNTPGRSWYDGFKERHPELCEKLSQNLQYSRACLNEESIRTWFKEVEEQFKAEGVLDIDASRVFNCDKSSFLLAPKAGNVLVEKGDKTAYSYVKNDDKECLTTLF
ncbi:uncharacterized protein LOC107044949 [Diachasma alloeum]|uniref:uncharacterized protein LOC107044949 n=1 Tax=Diachasma alloeum TaxID=454923 RepID=UPI0007383BF3|nr:uncharacterized protein LOC107044949 [Diachasma alloeum]